jgi:hypothetical protein
MRISAFGTAVLTWVVVGHPPPAVAQVDQQRAQDYFKEAELQSRVQVALRHLDYRTSAPSS